MSDWLNGHKKAIGWGTALAALFSIGSSAVTAMVVWDKKVDAGVVQREMVNRHDATLQQLLPRVAELDKSDARHDWVINTNGNDIARLTREVERLTMQVQTLSTLQQEYLQDEMRRGRIQR